MNHRILGIIFLFLGSYAHADSLVSTKSCEALFQSINQSNSVSIKGAFFLHQKNQNLHISKSVEQIARKIQLATKIQAKNPAQKIENWLKFLEQVSQKASFNPQILTRLKNSYYKLYVIKPNEIPQSYYDYQVRLARERGHGNVAITDEMKSQLAEILIKDQQKSLDDWIEYLVSPDSFSYPMWAKYWAFQGMIKLSGFNKETQNFGNREKTTTAPFVELNREAFAFVIDAVVKKLNKNSLDEIKDPQFLKLLDGLNFGKLYSRALMLSKTGAPGQDLQITEGRWMTYPKGSDYKPLVESLKGKNTGWCTAGETTAKNQLEHGDFHVYYSFDQSGKPTIPRVAIRMEDSKIAEIRGIEKNQNLDSFIADSNIVTEKLKEFGTEAKRYQKKSDDMTFLTMIDNKNHQGLELTKNELRFLYELDDKIEGFGYQKDPRIEEILTKRNIRKDYAFMLNIKESEIALTLQEALLPQTKYMSNEVFFKILNDNAISLDEIINKIININAKDNFGNTALTSAVYDGHDDLVFKLIEKGADINAKDDKDLTALILAAYRGQSNLALKLIELGADINAKDNYGNTTLISSVISAGVTKKTRLSEID